MVYIGLETGHNGAKFAGAVSEYAVRAGYLSGRAVVMGTCARACLPTEAQLVETLFELAVFADRFGGRVLVVSASAFCVAPAD